MRRYKAQVIIHNGARAMSAHLTILTVGLLGKDTTMTSHLASCVNPLPAKHTITIR